MPPLYLGIDPTAGKRPMDYAVLDDDLRVVQSGAGSLEELLALIRAQPSAVIAIDAPQSPNTGRMADPEVRQRYGLSVNSKIWTGYRACEHELRKRDIRLYTTPVETETAPAWMQAGFQLFNTLRAEGYETYRPNSSAPKQLLEVHPHACYTVLLGHLPFRKDTLEGRLQRQCVLFDEGLDIPDPMDSVEEITRHHLLEGTLDLPHLFSHDQLDALAAAYTAYLAAHHPEKITLVGDPAEGQIVVPVATSEFKDTYRKASDT